MISLEKIVALAKRRGFIFPGSEIYGGLANTYDYGPAGAELLRNIKNLWWENFVQKRTDVVGLDASLISKSQIWDASGHTSGFADALIDCKNCKGRYRADHLLEDNSDQFSTLAKKEVAAVDKELLEKIEKSKKVEGLSPEQLESLVEALQIKCQNCKKSFLQRILI